MIFLLHFASTKNISTYTYLSEHKELSQEKNIVKGRQNIHFIVSTLKTFKVYCT